MNNRRLHILTAVLSVMLAASSCDFRPLYIEGSTPVEVLVLTDWTQLGGIPSGASIYFYPEGGGKPWVFKTNSVTRTTVKVPSGYYTVQVFNRTVDEFGSMTFSGMDSLGTAEAVLEEKLFTWVGRADTIGRTVYEPEEIVVGRSDHFLVRSVSEREAYQRSSGKVISLTEIIDSVAVRPQRLRYTANMSVRINGIENIKSMRAYLTGMAGDAYLATRIAGNTQVTHVLESWSVERDAADYTKGYVKAEFNCFGLPRQYVGAPFEKNNKLLLQFQLVDNKTVVQEIRYVGELVEQNDADRTDLIVIDTAITLPTVKPEGGKESGFDVSFTDWDDPVDIPIGI